VSPFEKAARVVALLAISLVSCRSPGTSQSGPEQAALDLFALAGENPRDDLRVDGMFELGPDDPGRSELLDALDELADAGPPQITDVQPLPGLGRVAIDLYAELDGGTIARYSVQLEPGAGGGWKVRWFQGPGLSWPRRRVPRGEGLTTSGPPG